MVSSPNNPEYPPIFFSTTSAVADPAPEVFGGVFGQGGQFAVGGDCRSGTEREDPFAGRRLFRGGLRRGGAQAAKGCCQEDQKS